jgi:hypothetical protein
LVQEQLLKDPSDANGDILLRAFQRSSKTRPLHLSDLVCVFCCVCFFYIICIVISFFIIVLYMYKTFFIFCSCISLLFMLITGLCSWFTSRILNLSFLIRTTKKMMSFILTLEILWYMCLLFHHFDIVIFFFYVVYLYNIIFYCLDPILYSLVE